MTGLKIIQQLTELGLVVKLIPLNDWMKTGPGTSVQGLDENYTQSTPQGQDKLEQIYFGAKIRYKFIIHSFKIRQDFGRLPVLVDRIEIILQTPSVVKSR